MLEHVLINGNPLVRQGIYLGNFRGERRICQMPERQPFTFHHRPNGQPIAHEVHRLRLNRPARPHIILRLFANHIQELLPKHRRRLDAPLFPPRDRDIRHPQPLRKFTLRPPPRPPLGFD